MNEEKNEFGEYIKSCFDCSNLRWERWGGKCGPCIREFCLKKNDYLKNSSPFIKGCEDFTQRIGDVKLRE